MANHDMTFLYTSCHKSWNTQCKVCQFAHLALFHAGERDCLDALLLSLLECLDDIATVAGSRDTNQDIAFTAKCLYLTAEYLVIAVIIADSCQDRRIRRERNGRKSLTLFNKAANKLCCDMLAVSRTATIAAKQDFMAILQCQTTSLCHLFDHRNTFLFQLCNGFFMEFNCFLKIHFSSPIR